MAVTVKGWFKLKEVIAPLGPTGLTAIAKSDVRIDLAWTANATGEEGYRIYRSSDEGVSWDYIVQIAAGSESFIDVYGLSTNCHYIYKVCSFVGAIESAFSNEADDWTAMKLVFTKRGDGSQRTLIGSMATISESRTVTIDGDAAFYANPTGGIGSTSWTITSSQTSKYVQVNSGTSNVYIFHKNDLYQIGWGSGSTLNGGITLSWANAPTVTFTYGSLARSLVNFGVAVSSQGNNLVTGAVADLPPNLVNLCLMAGFSLTGTCADLPDTLTYLYLGGSAISGSIAGLPSGLMYCRIEGQNTLSGSISNVPINCTYFSVTGSNTLSGSLADLPQGELESFYVTGSNTISGAIADLDYSGCVLAIFQLYGNNSVSGAPSDISSSITRFELGGNSNTFSGDIAGFPATLDYIYVTGSSSSLSGDVANLSEGLLSFTASGPNTIEGDIANLPSTLTYIAIYGSNTLTGNVSGFSANIRIIGIAGNNTISGDISGMPDAITNITIGGNNTIEGNISGIPTSTTYFDLQGSNTLTGSVAGLSSAIRMVIIKGNNTISGATSDFPSTITQINITGLNTISGDLADISNSITQFILEGNNTVSVYTSGKTWSSGFIYYFMIKPVSPGGLDATEVDNLFIDLDTSWTTTRSQAIDVRGTNAAPTAASLSARNSLIAKGRTIYTN